MKYLMSAAAALSALLFSAQVEAKKEPLRLKHSSQWNVDYAYERCRLIRKFGEGENQVFAIFDQTGPGEYFRLTIAGKPVKFSSNEGRLNYQFGPNETGQDMDFYMGNLGEEPALIFKGLARLAPPTKSEQALIDKAKKGEWIELAPLSPERLDAIRTLTIGKPLRRSVILETGTMRKPMEAMGTCIDNLMRSWGIDVDRHRKLTRKAEPSSYPGRWVTPDDYPVKMLNAGQSALIDFRLSVNAEGMPTGCFIQLTTRAKEFDAAVCNALMKRARFTPALDADGKPINSFYKNTIHFVTG
jgi:hypothetical protein